MIPLPLNAISSVRSEVWLGSMFSDDIINFSVQVSTVSPLPLNEGGEPSLSIIQGWREATGKRFVPCTLRPCSWTGRIMKTWVGGCVLATGGGTGDRTDTIERSMSLVIPYRRGSVGYACCPDTCAFYCKKACTSASSCTVYNLIRPVAFVMGR